MIKQWTTTYSFNFQKFPFRRRVNEINKKRSIVITQLHWLTSRTSGAFNWRNKKTQTEEEKKNIKVNKSHTLRGVAVALQRTLIRRESWCRWKWSQSVFSSMIAAYRTDRPPRWSAARARYRVLMLLQQCVKSVRLYVCERTMDASIKLISDLVYWFTT